MEENNEDRRRSRRRRTLKSGILAFNDRFSTTNCTIRNESDTGALLFVDQTQAIPVRCELKQLPGKDYRPIEVVWRTPSAMGIRYLDVRPTGEGPMVWNDVEERYVEEKRRGERRRN